MPTSNDIQIDADDAISCYDNTGYADDDGGLHQRSAEFTNDDVHGSMKDVTGVNSEDKEGMLDNFYGVLFSHSNLLWKLFYVVMLCGWLAFLAYACYLDIQASITVLSLTVAVLAMAIYVVVRDKFGDEIDRVICMPLGRGIAKNWNKLKWILYVTLLSGGAVGLYFLTRDNPEHLISGIGLVFFVLFGYIFSISPKHIKWRPVIWGLCLQLILGVFILRTTAGFKMFEWLGNVVTIFLEFSNQGAEFVFGDTYTDHFFAFSVLPVVIYFGACISILYYLGAMQVLIRKIAWLMERTMKTSAPESLNAAGNIFVGMTEGPLLIKPMVKDLTKSELHAVMTGGFATIAGSVLGAYIAFGINASHLLSASVMSAPAALAISKLLYPETEKSKAMTVDEIDLPNGQERNIVEAASSGASSAIPLALSIAANLIAFIALLTLFNAILGYLGALVGVPELSFEFICSYVFMPLAFIMGVEWTDCRIVAELIGLKTFLNEFVAYEKLAEYIDMRDQGLIELSTRSEIIATYALCGFSNIGGIGIILGGLTPIAPSRAPDIAGLAVRALIAGSVACFMTACVAGILYDVDDYQSPIGNLTTVIPTTFS